MPKVLFVDQKETSVTYWIAELTKYEIAQLKSSEQDTTDIIVNELNEYKRMSYYHLLSPRYSERTKEFRKAIVIERCPSRVKTFFTSYWSSKGTFSFDDDGQKYLITSGNKTLMLLAAHSNLNYDNQRMFFDMQRKSIDASIVCTLVENPKTHKDIQIDALSAEIYDLSLVKNHNLCYEVQEELYKKSDYLHDLALNRNLSLDLQKKILNHKSYKVRKQLARNKNLYKEIFLALAKDKSKLVTKALIKNGSIKGEDKIRIRILSGLFT